MIRFSKHFLKSHWDSFGDISELTIAISIQYTKMVSTLVRQFCLTAVIVGTQNTAPPKIRLFNIILFEVQIASKIGSFKFVKWTNPSWRSLCCTSFTLPSQCSSTIRALRIRFDFWRRSYTKYLMRWRVGWVAVPCELSEYSTMRAALLSKSPHGPNGKWFLAISMIISPCKINVHFCYVRTTATISGMWVAAEF